MTRKRTIETLLNFFCNVLSISFFLSLLPRPLVHLGLVNDSLFRNTVAIENPASDTVVEAVADRVGNTVADGHGTSGKKSEQLNWGEEGILLSQLGGGDGALGGSTTRHGHDCGKWLLFGLVKLKDLRLS